MPIRFRCTACSKLLGIARRKAGTVIRCPECGAEVAVPTEPVRRAAARGKDRPRPERVRAAPTPAAHAGNGAPLTNPPESLPLFERPDFESLLNPAVKKATAPPQERSREPRGAVEPDSPLAQLTEPDRKSDEPYELEPAGLVISRGNLTVMAVVVVVLIGLAFAAGYLLAAARLPAAG